MDPRTQDLKRRTKQFAIRVLKLVDSLPTSLGAKAISYQLVRSGTSVAANYRAACRSRSKAEFAAKIGIVLEEADETLFWLELLAESGLVPVARLSSLTDEANQLTAIFAASSKTSRDGVDGKSKSEICNQQSAIQSNSEVKNSQ